MKPKKGPSVTDLMDSLVGDVIQIQKKLDAQFIDEANRFVLDYLHLPEAQKQFYIPSLPQRQFLKKHEVSARISFRTEKTTGVSVSVSLLNLSADIRFKRENSTDSSVKIEIEQVPIINNHHKP